MTDAPNGRRPRPLQSGGAFWGRRRVELGMSLAELAEASGVARAYLSQIESGRMIPTPAETERVIDALSRRAAEVAEPTLRADIG